MDINIEHRLTEVEARSKSNCHRLDEIEKRQGNLEDLTGTVKVLAVREAQVESDVKEMKSDVKSLINKPGKRWEKIVESGITVIIGAVLGFILGHLGF